MTNAKAFDIDAMLDDEDETPTVKMKLFGREWTVYAGLNSFTVSAISAGDAGAVAKLLGNAVIDEERADFTAAFHEQKNMNGTKLTKIIEGYIEAVSEHPTKSPSASSRPASKRTSAPKSTVRRS